MKQIRSHLGGLRLELFRTGLVEKGTPQFECGEGPKANQDARCAGEKASLDGVAAEKQPDARPDRRGARENRLIRHDSKQVLRKLSHRLVAILRLGSKAGLEDSARVRFERSDCRSNHWIIGSLRGSRNARFSSWAQASADEQLEEDEAKRVDIGSGVEIGFSSSLFRTHVFVGTESASCERLSSILGAETQGDSEIDDSRRALIGDEEIARFQIAMHDSLIVDGGESAGGDGDGAKRGQSG